MSINLEYTMSIYSLKSIIIILHLAASTAFCGNINKYHHPNHQLNMIFEALADWVEIAGHEKGDYEMSDPEGNVHIRLWFTDTVGSGRKYLEKMCDMNDLTFDEEISERTIDGRKALWAYTSGKKNGLEVKELIALISTDHSDIPDHRRLYIVRIWCAGSSFEIHRQQMDTILNSVTILDDKVYK